MSKGDVVKAKNRADTKTEIPRGVLFADAGDIPASYRGRPHEPAQPIEGRLQGSTAQLPVGVLEEALR